MSLKNWMSWEGGVDLIAKTDAALKMPNVIVHVARMVHTPVGSAPGGMLFWQPDTAAAPLVFGFISSNATHAAYFANHIFAGTPFEGAPALIGTVDIAISANEATARIEIPGFIFESRLSKLGDLQMIQRAPLPTAPFTQQGLEIIAGEASLTANGKEIALIVPPVGITGGPCAVISPTGLYSR